MFIIHKPFDDAELAEVVTASIKDLAKPLESTAELPPEAEAPEAPVDEPDDPHSDTEPVSEQSMQQQLQAYLGKIPFRLIAHDPMTSAKLTPTNLLGLYTAEGRKGVYAIGVLDANAICMIGGGGARKGPPEVRAAMESGQPDETMQQKAHEFLRQVASSLGESAGPQAGSVALAKASMVKNTFAKLSEVLMQMGQRSDFRISIPGYGEGRMAFFVMPVAA